MTKKYTVHGVKVQQWNDVHRDYKNTINGVQYVLVMDEKGATVSMKLKEAKKRSLI